MKLLLDVEDHKVPYFMELLKRFNYVKAKPLTPSFADLPEKIKEAGENMKKKNQYDEFLHCIQQAKMRELWDNKEDEDWENA
jgi:hypothetical protein